MARFEAYIAENMYGGFIGGGCGGGSTGSSQIAYAQALYRMGGGRYNLVGIPEFGVL